ncbi:MAG: NAD(P)/FAD-dependent oxidoreductase [Gloeocapsa sp. DLM2.Bin57]|nr:MAG: NAD(P)/FAD-dependent oxidoreductase [Gloeocapsa sp. DLM2.Bin57]
METNQSTVILGGGFVGLFCALHLSHKHYPHPIILIDQNARFVFKPLLFEFLTGEMESEQVLPRYEELLQGSNVTFRQDTISNVDLVSKRVELGSGLHYNYSNLVLALGSTQGYFGTEGAQENAFAFRTGEDAIALEKHLRQCLLKASQTNNEEHRQASLTFAVVGAGPSGVEMAATLADLLPIWYEQLGGNIKEIQVILINRSQEILTGDINSHLRKTALLSLKSRTVPVKLLLGVAVQTVKPNQLIYKYKDKDEVEVLATETIIWTAGTATNLVIQNLAIPPEDKDKHGLPIVKPTLQLSHFPEVFAAGDCAVVQDHPLPALAQIAYQQAATIANNIKAFSEHKELHPAKPKLRGTLMKLGIKQGVANLFNKYEIQGKIGDLIRNAVYLEMLPTPIHNFKATKEWLTDEIFHQYHKPQSIREYNQEAKKYDWIANWIGGSIMAIILVVGGTFAWRVMRPSQEQPQPNSSLFDHYSRNNPSNSI